MAKMLAKVENNCPWGCCPEFGRKGKKLAKRHSRRVEDRFWKKDWSSHIESYSKESHND